MTACDDPVRHNEMAKALAATGQYRVLRRLTEDLGLQKVKAGDLNTSLHLGSATSRIGCVVDVETAGLEVDRHPIIELALRRFQFDDEHGAIIALDRPYAWRQDPGAPLDPRIVALTGLTDGDLAGQSIDEDLAGTILRSASVVIAHNAGFYRPFVEHRLPASAGLAWACTMREVDWLERGVDGRGLGWLLAQCGWYHGAHRAGADVDAVLALLRHRFVDGTTVLSELLDTASKHGCLIWAVGAHFDVKDALKARGYRWDSASSVWWREIRGGDQAVEEAWLAEHVYAPCHRPRMSAPDIEAITWHTRHGHIQPRSAQPEPTQHGHIRHG